MMRRLLFLVVAAGLISGCVPFRDIYREQLGTLPHRYAQFDVKMAWQARVVGEELFIDGVVKNIRYAEMDSLEIRASLRDSRNNAVARSTSFIIPHRLKLDESAPFSLKLPLQTAPGGKLLFTYQYRFQEAGEDGDRWMQSFETEAP
jgi:hypothetical protein